MFLYSQEVKFSTSVPKSVNNRRTDISSDLTTILSVIKFMARSHCSSMWSDIRWHIKMSVHQLFHSPVQYILSRKLAVAAVVRSN